MIKNSYARPKNLPYLVTCPAICHTQFDCCYPLDDNFMRQIAGGSEYQHGSGCQKEVKTLRFHVFLINLLVLLRRLFCESHENYVRAYEIMKLRPVAKKGQVFMLWGSCDISLLFSAFSIIVSRKREIA